jgi:receptor-interacting serine/threonine-protein kinase 5
MSLSSPASIAGSRELIARLVGFSRAVLTSHCVSLAATMHDMHTRLLNAFILTAFDMARDQMITPKRLSFARAKEAALYAQLLAVTQQQQDHVQEIIHRAIIDMRRGIVQSVVTETPEYPTDFEQSTSSMTSSCSLFRDVGPLNSADAVEMFVLRQLNQGIADRLSESFHCLRVTFIDTITRCLNSLEQMEASAGGVQSKENRAASEAFKEILNATYTVEITVQSGRSFLQMLWEKMKQAVNGPPRVQASYSSLQLSEEVRSWRKRVAGDVIDNLSEGRLARSICTQLRERVKGAHDNFNAALDNLDVYHRKRLTKAEDQHLRLRKQHAPKMARLTMESLALRDVLLQGMPLLGPEVGRGQYGVVYACERWGSNGPCAVKSVVPPDDKHWNDLALEFFYTKNLPEHKRIVRLHGAVIDHNYGGGGMGMGAVLLIMERLKRDLYTGIRVGLPWPARLRVAIDVVEGIRFLHSQGLVHRDIKLKNVLLDDQNRGKITDLGFCKPEAMMSGSIVGTPIHMAPELFSGHYDASVDVYAFGILFWYICAGHVRLPQAFEACASKDQLWNCVRKGTRPECLKAFDDECWDIMKSSWSGDPAVRPHLGIIQPRLERILFDYKSQHHLSTSNTASLSSRFKLSGRPTIT